MGNERFELAAAMAAGRDVGGIGTRNEGPLHATLKFYFEPNKAFHEILVEGFVVDIKNEAGCTEIQTRDFRKIKSKLAALLAHHVVMLVYPIAAVKWVRWLDPATGQITAPRKSPKQCLPAAAFAELGYIKEFLFHPNLRLCIVMLELEEYKYLDGYGESRKRRATRAMRVPLNILGELHIDAPAQLALLLPPGLPPAFTSDDFRKAGSIGLSAAQAALNILCAAGIVARTGKRARRYLYARASISG